MLKLIAMMLKLFAIVINRLNVSRNYFDNPTKLFSVLYLQQHCFFRVGLWFIFYFLVLRYNILVFRRVF